MTAPTRAFAQRNGWTLLRASAFLASVAPLEDEVKRLKAADLEGFVAHPKAKLLARIRELVVDEIPRDPNAPHYALGNTLGSSHRHWRRAKFLQRFRLFFRFDSGSRVIVYAWINDENTLRKAGSRNDPYAVFSRRLRAGDPPGDWQALLADAWKAEDASGHP